MPPANRAADVRCESWSPSNSLAKFQFKGYAISHQSAEGCSLQASNLDSKISLNKVGSSATIDEPDNKRFHHGEAFERA